MTLFDTSVLIAAVHSKHVHHVRAMRAFAQTEDRCISTHALAETYAVLTRLPLQPRIELSFARQTVASLVDQASVIPLDVSDYLACLELASQSGTRGAGFYGLLHIRAAQVGGASRILTLNLRHFTASLTVGVSVEEP